MFPLMLPWLIIACLVGVVLGLVIGIYIASSLVQRHYHHFQSVQTQPSAQPLSGYRRAPVQYLDDEPFGRLRR
ncbi:hypothetical protein [Dictyobacter arantiisoli]|uniref:Uncharacterized protein n=1 Tax=Dictyobacter arantiisoli TaxID=2014874 RepID=A0A5A5T9S4_9CHLR|nr:hypothetical protein [Dictyobacter arantiisoli]GCF08087.1 hypothetical protein KDI_16510 [Dictyobacter arantiisoli]